MFAYDHARVHFVAGFDEQLAALLQVEHGVGRHAARTVGHQRAGGPVRDGAGPRAVAVEEVVEQAGTLRVGQKLAPVADQSAGGDLEFEPNAPRAVVDHLREHAPTYAQLLHDDAHVFLGHVDQHALVGLVEPAVDAAREHTRLAHRELVPLAAHLLDQDRQLQLATSVDEKCIGRVRLLDAQRQVVFGFLEEALAQVARGDVLAFASGKRAVVDAKLHRERGLVDVEGWQRMGIIGVGDRLAQPDALHARHGHDGTRAGRDGFDALQAFELEKGRHRGRCAAAVLVAQQHALAVAERTLHDAADGERPAIGIGLDVRYQ